MSVYMYLFIDIIYLINYLLQQLIPYVGSQVENEATNSEVYRVVVDEHREVVEVKFCPIPSFTKETLSGVGYNWLHWCTGACCSSGRASTYNAMGRWIDLTWGTYELFLIPASAPQEVIGHGMCYSVCGMVHIKDSLLLLEKSNS